MLKASQFNDFGVYTRQGDIPRHHMVHTL